MKRAPKANAPERRQKNPAGAGLPVSSRTEVSAILGVLPTLLLTRLTRFVLSLLLLLAGLLRPTALLLTGLLIALLLLTWALIWVLILVLVH